MHLDEQHFAALFRQIGHDPACRCLVDRCTEVRRLVDIAEAAREVVALDGHMTQSLTEMADDLDWQGSERHIPVEVSRPAFVALLRALAPE